MLTVVLFMLATVLVKLTSWGYDPKRTESITDFLII